jgi:endonuclease/exonuclease/phosphatase family metal-dependent hydrolase
MYYSAMSLDFIPPSNDNISKSFADIVPPEHIGSDKYIDIITWNIWFFDNKNQQRVKQVTDVLERLNGDIFVFQEIEENSLDIVAEELLRCGAGSYKIKYGTTGGDQRVAIMYDKEWIKAKDNIEEIFDRTLTTPEGKEVFPRLPLRAYFTSKSDISDPFDFQILGLHLKSQRGGGEEQRKLAALNLKKWMLKKAPLVDADVIMIGDWNEDPDAKAWNVFRDLERKKKVAFRSINNKSSISHLMYKSKNHLGSRLDLAAVSMAAVPEMGQPPKVVRWKSLDSLLAKGPKAQEIKKYLKSLKTNLSDHLPVITRFYFTEQ